MPVSYLGQYDDNQKILQRLDTIASQVSALPTGGAVTGGNILADASLAQFPLNVNNPARDIIYLLGASETATFVNPITSGSIATTSGSGNPLLFYNRLPNNTNTGSGIQVDFGANKPDRGVKLTGLGVRTGNSITPSSPFATRLIIQGMTTTQPLTPIFTFNWTGVGFTGLNQWRYVNFANTIFARIWRVSTTDGDGSFNLGQLRFYGDVSNP